MAQDETATVSEVISEEENLYDATERTLRRRGCGTD